jgi:hypothetical protein
MLTNSFVIGALAASYVVVLFLQLNPALPCLPLPSPPWPSDGFAVALSAIAYAFLCRALFGRDRFSPAWISVSVLAWAGCAAAAGSAEMWANDTFGVVLETKTTETLWRSAIVVGVRCIAPVLAITQRYSSVGNLGGVGLWRLCALRRCSRCAPQADDGVDAGISPLACAPMRSTNVRAT